MPAGPGRHARAVCAAIAIAAVAWLAEDARAQSAAPDAVRANGYDDAWQSQWVGHGRALLAGAGKTDGFVLQIGDSITYSRASAASRSGGLRSGSSQACVAST